jgi:uncharacterized protein
MIVDLLSVTDKPLAFNFHVAPDEIDLETEDVRIKGEIEVKGELQRNATVDVKGVIKTPLEIDCTRCLTPVEHDMNVEFHVDFVDKGLFPDSKETHLGSSDLDTDVIEGNELDLKEIAREQILLNLPEQVLCREDCKGICPTCGADLNKTQCNCGENEIDPRWAALKDLTG